MVHNIPNFLVVGFMGINLWYNQLNSLGRLSLSLHMPNLFFFVVVSFKDVQNIQKNKGRIQKIKNIDNIPTTKN